MHVLFAGATGLVGEHLLARLRVDSHVSGISILARRDTSLQGGKVQCVVVDFSTLGAEGSSVPIAENAALATMGAAPAHADAAVCSLGTTRKAAGSREAFAAVDRDAVLAFAKFAKRAGVKTFVLVSALGADARSRVFYSRIKGETEEALRALGFSTLHIVRPSLLVGKRKDFRLAEAIGVRVAPLLKRLLVGPLAPYAPVQADDVAATLQACVFDGRPGVHIHSSETLGKTASPA